jgi:hypothetical protein
MIKRGMLPTYFHWIRQIFPLVGWGTGVLVGSRASKNSVGNAPPAPAQIISLGTYARTIDPIQEASDVKAEFQTRRITLALASGITTLTLASQVIKLTGLAAATGRSANFFKLALPSALVYLVIQGVLDQTADAAAEHYEYQPIETKLRALYADHAHLAQNAPDIADAVGKYSSLIAMPVLALSQSYAESFLAAQSESEKQKITLRYNTNLQEALQAQNQPESAVHYDAYLALLLIQQNRLEELKMFTPSGMGDIAAFYRAAYAGSLKDNKDLKFSGTYAQYIDRQLSIHRHRINQDTQNGRLIRHPRLAVIQAMVLIETALIQAHSPDDEAALQETFDELYSRLLKLQQGGQT